MRADGHGANRSSAIGFACDTQLQPFPEPMPVKVEPTPPLASLSPVAGKSIIARFDGGQLSTDAGVLLLREVEQRLGVAKRLAACIDDPRLPGRVRPEGGGILRFPVLVG